MAEGQVQRIGYLTRGAESLTRIITFRDALREMGWVEGQNIVIERRSAAGRYHRLSKLAVELSREPVIARQVFRKLIDGRLKMTPRIMPEGRVYEVHGRAIYGRLLEGVISGVGLVPPG